MFFLEIKPTIKCNQSCYYCDVHGKSKFKNKQPVADIDYLKFVLNCHKDAKLFIQISGGEVGLLKNLNEFINCIAETPNVDTIKIQSNGLLRKNNFDFSCYKNLIYFEHLIFDIEDKKIKLFYDLKLKRINRNHKFVVVTTEKTVDSLINNFNYFRSIGLFRDKFVYKIIVPKSYGIDFLEKLYLFYRLLAPYQDTNWELFRLDGVIKNHNYDSFKSFCAINPPQPFVDFETKELGHCGVVSETGRRFPFTRTNAELNMQCSLFRFERYCRKCYVYDYSSNKIDCTIRSKRGEYCNRSYVNV